MKHSNKLINKTEELIKKHPAGNVAEITDSVYQFHKNEFLTGCEKSRAEFNNENGLRSTARPEKSLWRVCEIVEEVFENRKRKAETGLVTVSEKSSDEELKAASFEIPKKSSEGEEMKNLQAEPNEPEIFGRINGAGNVDLLRWETGESVTRFDCCWPLNSDLSGSYEHPEGIELSREDAERLKIPLEGVDC
jgi:hypothetical protein